MILGPIKYSVIEIPIDDSDYNAFNQFLDNYRKGAVLSFSSRAQENSFMNMNTGLCSYHGYGLLDVCENVLNTGLTLIKCHNPWSAGGEWSGEWSDSSELWNKYPKIKLKLNFELKDDGTFWIEKKDFSKAFCLIWVAYKI